MRGPLASSIRPIATASILSLTLVGIGHIGQPAAAYAAPNTGSHTTKRSCQAAGYVWDSATERCADLNCTDGGTPGDIRFVRRKDGTVRIQVCDGFSGTWMILVRESTPTGPSDQTGGPESVSQ